MDSLIYQQNANTILNSLNDNVNRFMKPFLEHYDEQLKIANEMNALLERLPKYKQLVEKYNDLMGKYELLERENNKLKCIRVSNNGFWYSDLDEINMKITDNDLNENKQIDEVQNNVINIYKNLNEIISTKHKHDEINNNDEENNEENEQEIDEIEEEDEEEEENEEECMNGSDSDVEVFEKIIGNSKYYVSDHINGDIYEYIDNDVVGKKIGTLKNGMAYL